MKCLHPVPYGYLLFSFVKQNSDRLIDGIGDIEGPTVVVVPGSSAGGVLGGVVSGSGVVLIVPGSSEVVVLGGVLLGSGVVLIVSGSTGVVVVSGSSDGVISETVFGRSVVTGEQGNPKVQSPVRGLNKVANGQVISDPFTVAAPVLG